MRKILWLLLLAIPPGVASALDAPKWAMLVSIVPFMVFAATLGDPDENLLGEGFKRFRKPTLFVLGAACLVLGVVFYILWRVLFP